MRSSMKRRSPQPTTTERDSRAADGKRLLCTAPTGELLDAADAARQCLRYYYDHYVDYDMITFPLPMKPEWAE